MLLQTVVVLAGFFLLLCGGEVTAAKIVAEEEEVIIQGGQSAEEQTAGSGVQTPEQENTKNNVYQDGQPPKETAPALTQEQNKSGGETKKSKKNTENRQDSSEEQSKEDLKEELKEQSEESEKEESSEQAPQDVSQNQLPEHYMGGIKQPGVSENQVVSQNSGSYQNQITIQEQIKEDIKEEKSITDQENSKKQSNEQTNESGTKKQWKAEGERNALLLGFFGIYGTILFAGFLFLFKKGGTRNMKKFLKKVTGCVFFALCLAVGSNAAGSNVLGSFVQAQTISENEVTEEENDMTETSENESKDQDLFTFDWRNASDEELDHILGITDFEKTGYWLKSLTEEELREVLSKETVLPKEMSVASYEVEDDGTMVETDVKENVIYYEYCMSQATGLLKAQTFQHSSGYYDYKFTMGSAQSHYRMKISGLSTTKDTSKQQTATLAVVAIQQTNGNFANFSSKLGNYNHSSGYTTKKLSNDFDGTGNYYILNAGFTFTKPAGYSVTLTKENAHSGYCNIYYYEEGAYTTNQKKFTSDSNTGSSVFESLVAHTNLYTNTTVGGSSQNAPDTPVCYHFTFTPVTYAIQYHGNGATSGSVSTQMCTYGNTYYVQNNGFSRQYNITYNGNGGISDKASEVVKYNFKGWGWFDLNNVTHIGGQAFSNAGNTSDYVGRFYAIWEPVSATLPSASRTGYLFNGWGTSDTASSGRAAKSTVVPTQNLVFYATWKPISYKVEFKDGFTDAVKGTQTMTYDKQAQLNTLQAMKITRAGYTFKGWKSSAGSYTDGQKVCNLTSQNNGTVTMTAEWKANNNTPYKVIHKVQNPSKITEYIVKDTETLKGTTDTAVTPDTKEYENYQAPLKKTVTIAGDGSTQVIYLYSIKASATMKYTVEHYLQDKNDKNKYNLDQENSKSYYAKVGEEVTPDIITTYEGYNIPSPQTIKIAANKENVVKYYYTLSESGSTTNVTNITNNNVDILDEGDTINEGDINNFKPGEIKYYTDAEGNQYEIVVNQDGTLTIRAVKFAENSVENLKIAGTLTINDTKYQVTEIAPYAFKNNKKIKTVTIGNGITTIGKGAFEGCTKLETVKFGVGLSVIGDRAFYGCTSLQKVKTTRSLTTIGSKAFYNCKKLKSYTIGKYVKSIGSYAFYNCRKLKKITLSESVEIVEKKAFYKCSSLKKVSIKTTKLIKIGSGAFKKCDKSLKFTVPAKKKKAYAKLLKGKS